MKVQLEGVQETLLIPLAARVKESKGKSPRLIDKTAVEIAEKIDYDFSKFEKAASQQGVIARTMILDREVQKFVDTYPEAICISIGCGLDTRYERIRHGKIKWINLDLPEVINIRKQLIHEGKNVSYIAKSALDPTWIDDLPSSGHILIVLEGILMYFTEVEVIQLFSILKNHFSECAILAEIMHPMIAKQSKHHDTVKQTSAIFKWGILSGKEMECLCQNLLFRKEWNLMDELTDQGLAYRIAAKLPMIRNKMNKIVKLEMKETER